MRNFIAFIMIVYGVTISSSNPSTAIGDNIIPLVLIIGGIAILAFGRRRNDNDD
ncbi:MAG: hypothetical protein HYW78_02165 [Parcubacteria group bacterium]|nr:hypothetical protein [Parcubacteria group bacterium]